MKKLLSIPFAMIPFILNAHPGHDGDHGGEGYTIIHFFNSPVHYISLLTVIVVALIIIYFSKKRRLNNKANA